MTSPGLQLDLSSASPFVGYRAALASVAAAFDDATLGRPRTILITGDPGVGKTRLLRELVPLAERRAMQICSARCLEMSASPYAPFASAVLPLLERAGAPISSRLRETLRPSASDRAGAGTELETRGGDIALELTEAVFALAARRPLVLLIDDLQWADSGTLTVLEHLILAAADTSTSQQIALGIILATRPPSPSAAAARLIRGIVKEDIVTRLALRGLNELEVNDLLRGLSGLPCSPPLVNSLFQATDGNPLFVGELLQLMNQEGLLHARTGQLAATGSVAELAALTEVGQAIAARAQALPSADADILTLASLVGDDFAINVLAEAEGKTEAEVSAAIELGVENQFIVETDDGGRFRHPLIRHAFQRRWSTTRRRSAHARLAALLQATASANPLAIADHLAAAGRSAPPGEAARAAVVAAERAFSVSAWGEAARYFKFAMTDHVCWQALSPEERARLALRTGVAQYRNLDVAASLVTYRLAMDAHREVKNYSGWAEALEGWIRAQISHDSAAAFRLVDCPEIAEFFAEIGPGPNHSRARARVEASYSEILFAAERPEATEVGARAFEVSHAEGDIQVTVHSAVALGLASWQQMRLEESARWFELGLEAARGGDDDWIQAWPLQRLPLPLISLGRLREATSVADRAAALAEGTHDWAEFSLTRATQCILALFQGTFDAAETFASDAALMYRRSDYQWIPPVLFPTIGQARLLRGDFQAASHAAELLSHSGLGGPAWLLKMLQLAYEGRTDLLAREFAANASRAGRKYPDNIFSAGPLAMRADLAALTATPEYAPDSIPRLKEFLKHGLLFSLTQGAYLLPRALADLEAVSGQWSDAEEHYEQAIAVARASRARTELALSLSGRARLLESRGDSEAAALVAEEANLAFGQIGIVPPLDRRTRQRPGAEGRRRTSASAGEDPLDLEILSDYSRGLSVRQSAARLLLSERSLAARLAAQRDRNLLRSPDSAVTYLREIGHRSGAAPSRTDGIQAFLVSDIVGSTRINAQIGDSAWVQLLQQHNEILRSAMEAFEGTEVKHTGDGIFAVFNSAANAVGCALAAARRFPVLETSNHSIRADVCMGISVGEAVGVQDDLFGLAVTQAFRICDRAGPGEVLVAEPVRQLLEGSRFSFEERGRFVLKGFKGRNLLYRASLA